MTISLSPHVRRALLLGLPLGVAACDLVSFIQDPKPIFEQTWNLPADSSQISVAEILPNGVGVYSTPASNPPDSVAFQVTVGNAIFQRRVGDDCASCQSLNGTTAIKPAFVLASGSATGMPSDIVTATVIAGQVNVQITNGLSFDPLRPKSNAPASTDPTQQGRLVIIMRSGSLVVGKDSVNGVTTSWAPSAVLNRTITLQTGNITGSLAIDLTLTSPASDTPVFINANGVVATNAAVPFLRVSALRMNVVNQTMTSTTGDSIPLDSLPAGVKKRVVGGGLDMTMTNPFNISGSVNVQFGYAPGQSITKTIAVAPGSAVKQLVTLDSAEMATLLNASNKVALTVTGTVNSPAPIDVTPKQTLIVVNRVILTIHTPE